MSVVDRRSFLRRGATVAGGSLFALPAMQGLAMRQALAEEGRGSRSASATSGGYGPLARKKPKAVHTQFPGAADLEWLALPEGFEYMGFGVTGDTMSDGNLTPLAHDGSAGFRAPWGPGRYVRDHGNPGSGGPPIAPPNAYH